MKRKTAKRKELLGRTAETEILSRLSEYPKAQGLFTEVIQFYGDFFKYVEDPGLSKSRYEINLNHKDISLEYALIEIQTGTRRVAEAIAHELLHLKLAIDGRAIGNGVTIPDELDKHAAHFLEMYVLVENLVDHDLNIDSFVKLGFEKSKFLGSFSRVPNYEAAAADAKQTEGQIPHEVGFSWWCMEYFGHWISMRHGLGKESKLNAETALYWGSTVEPYLIDTAARMREWVESGKFKEVESYSQELNILFQLMKLPRKTRWLTLRSSETEGKPIVELVSRDS